MKFITIEEHITNGELVEDFVRSQSEDGELNPSRMDFFKEKALVGGLLTNIDERLKYMDKTNTQIQVLSYINFMSDAKISDNIKTERAIQANNFLKSVVDKYPDRFRAFAYLPLWDVDASVKELERCVKELGFNGTLVAGKFNGHFLDEKMFFPIFEKAATLDVPVYFHPSMPVKEIQDYYYTSHDGGWSDLVAREFGSAGFGWHLDVGIQLVRMILTGIFDKLPNLKLITGHWGEGIPAMLDRMDCMIAKKITGLQKNISQYYKENVYVTPSGILSDVNLKAITEYMGTDHIIWSVDYPYIRLDDTTDFLMKSDLTDEEKELISHKNAEKVLKL